MENFVEQDASAPHVDFVRLELPQDDFRGHVFFRAAEGVLDLRIGDAGAEVCQLGHPVARQQDVLRLDVAVDNALPVQIVDAVQDLVVNLQLFAEPHLFELVQIGEEIAPLDVLQ